MKTSGAGDDDDDDEIWSVKKVRHGYVSPLNLIVSDRGFQKVPCFIKLTCAMVDQLP